MCKKSLYGIKHSFFFFVEGDNGRARQRQHEREPSLEHRKLNIIFSLTLLEKETFIIYIMNNKKVL